MHLGNGAITPECGVNTLGAATRAAVADSLARSKPLDRKTTFTAEALAAGLAGACRRCSPGDARNGANRILANPATLSA